MGWGAGYGYSVYVQVIYEDAAQAAFEDVFRGELVGGWVVDGYEGGEEHWGV